MFIRSFLFFLIFHFLPGRKCYECQFFNNIRVIVTPKSKVPYFHQHVLNNFSGCFEQSRFDQTIVELAVVDEDITIIGDHAVNDLKDLESLSFTGCRIQNISKRAFENLPKLKKIHINHANLTALSGGIFNDLPSLEDLSFFGNDINFIATQTFAAMSSLNQVILSRNKLNDLYSTWYSDSPNITLLDFSFNKIKRLEKLSFIFTRKLKDLFLDYNEIEFIEEGTFRHLNNMEILSLRHNKITELNPNIFGELFKVEVLHLNANYLNFLARNLLRKLSVRVLELEGNPWRCPCLQQIHKWMLQNNVTLKKGFCRGHHIPNCFYDDSANFCSETSNSRMTKSYLKTLANLNPPVDEECANLP